MAWDTLFESLMPETVTLVSRTGANDCGEPEYSGAPVTAACRVEYVDEVIRDRDGVEQVVTARVYLAGSYGVDAKDRVTMPDGSQPPIVAVDVQHDGSGPHHEVLLVGRARRV